MTINKISQSNNIKSYVIIFYLIVTKLFKMFSNICVSLHFPVFLFFERGQIVMKNYTTFKHPYVLIEDTKSKYQPFYKEYQKDIPFINLSSPALCCPFSNARRATTLVKKKQLAKSGYCEICFMKFDNYDLHVNTNDHKEFSEDSYNYRKIDAFIETIRADTEEIYYKIPSSPCDKLEELLKHSDLTIRGNYYDSDSLIRLSKDSESVEYDIVTFDTILFNIDKKSRKDR